MKKIVTVCGMGLGSSLIVEMNTKKAIQALNLNESEFEVTHQNLNSYSSSAGWDIVICGQDLADNIDAGNAKKVVLNNLMDSDELIQKLKEVI